MIVLVTDFAGGPYTAQVEAVLSQGLPGTLVVRLFDDAPAFDPQATAYLLAAYAEAFPRGTVLLCVVDPGVGSAREGCIVQAQGRWYVGPDNGLFEVVLRRTGDAARAWHINWQPPRLSASFHGRDLFAPVAVRVARGGPLPALPVPAQSLRRTDWPDDLFRVVYVDGYGNAMTGVRASCLASDAVLVAGDRNLRRARTFSCVPVGQAFWYENANGLAEIAVNGGSAAQRLGLRVGATIAVAADCEPDHSPGEKRTL